MIIIVIVIIVKLKVRTKIVSTEVYNYCVLTTEFILKTFKLFLKPNFRRSRATSETNLLLSSVAEFVGP